MRLTAFPVHEARIVAEERAVGFGELSQLEADINLMRRLPVEFSPLEAHFNPRSLARFRLGGLSLQISSIERRVRAPKAHLPWKERRS